MRFFNRLEISPRILIDFKRWKYGPRDYRLQTSGIQITQMSSWDRQEMYVLDTVNKYRNRLKRLTVLEDIKEHIWILKFKSRLGTNGLDNDYFTSIFDEEHIENIILHTVSVIMMYLEIYWHQADATINHHSRSESVVSIWLQKP